jgi:hypothetical protein
VLNPIRLTRVGAAAVITTLVVAVVAIGGVGIPDADGVIHACYKNSTGAVRIVASASDCNSSETALSWDQSGGGGGSAGATVAFVPVGMVDKQFRAEVPYCEGAWHIVQFASSPVCNDIQFPPELLGSAVIDPANYPADATFHLEAIVVIRPIPEPPSTFCLRLYDLDLGQPVSGSEVCGTQPRDSDELAIWDSFVLESQAIQPAVGGHRYTVQVRQGSSLQGISGPIGIGQLMNATIVVDW